MTLSNAETETHEIAKYKQVVDEAALEMKNKVTQLQTFKQDYEDLMHVLEDLPKKTSHPIMVPLGSLAFMPGHIVHTNEITVSLGDGWYVERSASQAKEIAQRRTEDLKNNISSLSKNLLALQERQKSFPLLDSKLFQEALLNEEGLPMLDIREPVQNETSLPEAQNYQPSISNDTPSITFIPADQKMTLTTEQQTYLSSIFDHVMESEESDTEPEFLSKTILKKRSSATVKENSSSLASSKKKVTFSNETLAQEEFKEMQQTLKDKKKSEKKMSSSPISNQVIERDTTLFDQQSLEEDMELQVEYNEILQAYHRQRNLMFKRHSSCDEEEETAPMFGKPFLPCSDEEKIELQRELSKLATSVSNMEVQSNDKDFLEIAPKRQSKFMQSRRSAQKS